MEQKRSAEAKFGERGRLKTQSYRNGRGTTRVQVHGHGATSSLVRLEVVTAVTMKNTVFWVVSRVALVRTNVSEELRASIIKATRIGELG
jgi:hypothetical protein